MIRVDSVSQLTSSELGDLDITELYRPTINYFALPNSLKITDVLEFRDRYCIAFTNGTLFQATPYLIFLPKNFDKTRPTGECFYSREFFNICCVKSLIPTINDLTRHSNTNQRVCVECHQPTDRHRASQDVKFHQLADTRHLIGLAVWPEQDRIGVVHYKYLDGDTPSSPHLVIDIYRVNSDYDVTAVNTHQIEGNSSCGNLEARLCQIAPGKYAVAFGDLFNYEEFGLVVFDSQHHAPRRTERLPTGLSELTPCFFYAENTIIIPKIQRNATSDKCIDITLVYNESVINYWNMQTGVVINDREQGLDIGIIDMRLNEGGSFVILFRIRVPYNIDALHIGHKSYLALMEGDKITTKVPIPEFRTHAVLTHHKHNLTGNEYAINVFSVRGHAKGACCPLLEPPATTSPF